MRPRTGNCDGTNAAEASYRPDVYTTDAQRDDSVTEAHFMDKTSRFGIAPYLNCK